MSFAVAQLFPLWALESWLLGGLKDSVSACVVLSHLVQTHVCVAVNVAFF
jgi:hypothetical protein